MLFLQQENDETGEEVEAYYNFYPTNGPSTEPIVFKSSSSTSFAFY